MHFHDDPGGEKKRLGIATSDLRLLAEVEAVEAGNPDRRSWENHPRNGSVSKPCTPGQHQNSW